MIQAAHFDIKTVTGLRQALVLSAEYENEPFPLEGYTLHGSIGTYPRMDLKCSVDENGRARIEWDSVPPGNWKYDVFLISASNDETPLMEGTFTALPRITPVLDDESVNDEVGGVLRLPSGNEGTITLEVDGGFVSKEYAAIAKDAADKAQQALAAIPQVDASGNMTLAGSFSATGGIFNGKLVVNNPNGSMGDGSYNQIYGLTWFYGQVEFRKGGILRGDLWVESGTVRIGANAAFNCSGSGTFAGTVNANGGINIPLAVGAPTDTSAVNRLYAAGMGGVTGILTSNAFLNTDAITASGSSTVTKMVPYHLAGIKVPKGTHSTIQARFEVSNPQWNYSSFAGFSFLWRATNAAKLSFGIGRGGKTIRPDLSIDSYSIIPANGLAYNHGEILDITFDNVRDTQRNGYIIKVREIYALTAAAGWQVKTTTSFIPASQNEPVPWTIAKVIYQQKSAANIAKYENTGALWLMLTGGQGNNLYQIATCRGVSNFETNVGVTQWVADVVNNTAGYVSVYAGTGEYTYYQPGGMNPVFYSLEAMAVNVIESEETADFVDVNTPLES